MLKDISGGRPTLRTTKILEYKQEKIQTVFRKKNRAPK